MSSFESIYSVVSKIPKGKVMTYQQVAKLSGVKSARTVGLAMKTNKNTRLIPCHRVIGSDGKLKGYAFGGIIQKKKLLEKEGIKFLNANTIDLSYSLVKVQP